MAFLNTLHFFTISKLVRLSYLLALLNIVGIVVFAVPVDTGLATPTALRCGRRGDHPLNTTYPVPTFPIPYRGSPS